MKKGFIALAVVALATAAFAQDAPKAPAAKAFTLSGGVDAYYVSVNTINGAKGAQQADYGTARSRPLFKVADGSSEFNLEFEMIGNYGVQNVATTAEGGNNGAPIGNDQVTGMKLRGMYFSSTVVGVEGLKLTAGLCPTLDLGMWEKDLSPGFVAAYSVPKLATISLAYFQINEAKKDGTGGQTLDSQYYSGTALVSPIDGLQVNFMGAYAQFGKNAPGVKGVTLAKKVKDGSAMMYGAWVKGTFGQIGISGIFQMATTKGKAISNVGSGTGQVLAGATYEGSAYAFNISPSFSLDKDTVFAVFYTNISGDDPKTKKNESWWDGTLDAQGFGHKMILFEDCGVFGNLDATNASGARVRAKDPGKGGYQLFGLTATTKIGGIYSPTVAVAYGILNQVASGAKKDLGIEFDLFNAIKISDATTLNIEYAFLKTGKAYKDMGIAKTQNAQSFAIGMTQKY